MANLTFDDFARIAASHSHGRLYVSTDPDQKVATLGRHLIRSTTPEQNVAVRQALANAICGSVYLMDLPAIKSEIKKKLGLAGGFVSAEAQKPLELREVRDLISQVHQASRQSLSCLLDEGMDKTKVLSLLCFLPAETQKEYVKQLAETANSTPERLKLLMTLHGEAEKVLDVMNLRRAMATGNVDYVAEYMEVHNPDLYRNHPDLSRSLLRAVIGRSIKREDSLLTKGLGGLPNDYRTVKYITSLLENSKNMAIRIASAARATKDQLWQIVNDRAAELMVGLPPDKQLAGLRDVSRYYAAKCDLIDYDAESDYFSAQTFVDCLARLPGEFSVGVKHLMTVSDHTEDADSEAEVCVRTSKFVQELFERDFDVSELDLPDFGQERLLARISAEVMDDVTEARKEPGFSLGKAFSDHEPRVYFLVQDCRRALELISSGRSASDEHVMGVLERELAEAGLADRTDAELDFVKRQYELQYAQSVLTRCGDPDLVMEDGAPEAAIGNVAKEAVQQLVAAKTMAEGVRKQVEGMVRAFREDPDVTEQMIDTLDKISTGMTQIARTELLLTDNLVAKVEELTQRFEKEFAAKIKEMKDARQLNLAHKVSEKYQAFWVDFDAKMKTVEGAYDAFVVTLPEPKLKSGRVFSPGFSVKADCSVDLQEAWMNACTAVRSNYAQVPKDYDAEMPKLEPFRPRDMLAKLRLDVSAIWQARCDNYCDAMDELEDFLRDSNLPDDVGITDRAWERSSQVSTSIRGFVIDVAFDIRKAAMAGDKAKVRDLLDGLKAAVGKFIAENNAREFPKPETEEGVVARGKGIMRKMTDLAIYLKKSKVSMPKGIGMGELLDEGITRVWDEFSRDTTHYHTRMEMADLVRARLDEINSLRDRMIERLRQRIIDRAEPEFYAKTNQDGGVSVNVQYVFDTDLDNIMARLLEEQRMSVSHTLEYDEEAVLKRMDELGDEVVRKMMAPRAAMLEKVQDVRVQQAREWLLDFVDKRMDKLGRKEKVLETDLRAHTVQWITARMDALMKPTEEQSKDGKIHGRIFREVDEKALAKELGAYIDQSIKVLQAQRKRP